MKSLPWSAVFALVAVAFLPCGSEANAFLGKHVAVKMQPRQEIWDVLEEELGSGHGRRADAARVMELQQELNHTFAALPKNSQGNLQEPSAFYALHRLFVQRHAWQVKGLGLGGKGWSNTSFTDALEGVVPAKAQMFFKDRFDKDGVTLHELAVLAALLESLIHIEVGDRLRITLQAFGENETASLNQDTATAILHAYMASYLFGVRLADLQPQHVKKYARQVQRAYPTWPDTQAFVNEVRDSFVSNRDTSYNFDLMSDILSKVGDKYGRWQSQECTALKHTLVSMESMPGSGRVRLSDFYGSKLRGDNWQFQESVDYLRQLGALDESSPNQPSVIIPNYIGGPSNCVAASEYYDVCCIDECEELMDHLELHLGAPTASVKSLELALSALPSQLSVANRTLSEALLRRLNDVAAYHEGTVPLHGRLFAQWMHHAYPRECSFPHVSGTIDPLRMKAFQNKTGIKAKASNMEMQQFTTAAASREQAVEEIEDGLCSNMWTMEEELVDASAHQEHQEAARARRTPKAAVALRGAMLCLAIVSMMLALAKTVMSVSEAALGQNSTAKGTEVSELHSRGVTYSV